MDKLFKDNASGRKLSFGVELEVKELVNVPLFDNTECFMVCTVTNEKLKYNYKHKNIHSSSYTSNPVLVKGHRVKFGQNGEYKNQFNIHAYSSKDSILADKWLSISFLTRIEGNDRTDLLGSTWVNLSEYVNERDEKIFRKLLDQSKTNTIVNMSLILRHLSNDGDKTYRAKSQLPTPIPTAARKPHLNTSIIESLCESQANDHPPSPRSPTMSFSKSHRLSVPPPKPVSPSKNDLSTSGSLLNGVLNHQHSMALSSPRELSKPYDNNLQQIMNEACESAIEGSTLLDELMNKIYRFTWEAKTTSYEEYTPAECVIDIVERNGSGWRKNEEGLNYIDVINNEFKESNQKQQKMTAGDYEDLNFTSDDDDDDDDDNDDGGDSDLKKGVLGRASDSLDSYDQFYSYYKDSAKRKNRTIRFKPLTEAEVREDLRSWHISVKDC